MRLHPIAFPLIGCCAALLAQERQTHTSALGFTYALPTDWQVVDDSGTLPEVKEQAQQNAATEEDKKGAACVNIALTARHGDPASVIVAVELPFACLGQTATEKDLPGFAQGASEGLKQSFDLTEPATSNYKLGTHNLWIERSKGAPKGHPELPYTVEVACTLLKKGAVCWMTMAADDAALKVFESGRVSLEDEPAVALVPPTAFKKPAP